MARTDRETKILDVAAGMLVRHGYRRVTIDDVAVAAGIGKGTVYLHWKTREQLFGAVFAREVHGAIADLVTALRADPAVALLHRFAAEFFLAIMRRPLLHGMVIGDVQMWGKLIGSEAGYDGGRHNAMMTSYVGVLAARHLVRADMTTPELTYAFQSVFEGFIYAERTAGSSGTPDDRAKLLSATVESAFSQPGTPDAALADEVAALLSDLA
ncbi:TetR/AcrR family transcriptional regulator [Catellatospora citrea]|uniref:TetR family transcriptional regulator n=1 Tax=Catellatospora citrea TaxID=53366 RepID=A0A8J3KQQ9_9ACTN|nr:TetR/AcrR family transcriptional regulator [Catellatospora citrea]RKE11929.1 TetR family transcriptional regulator [Catellatospora citrea]GIG00265.1 TetR family transcriptional regulator [Catellatospora citrea]